MAFATWAPAAGGFNRRVSSRRAGAASASGEGGRDGAGAGHGDGQAAGNRERSDQGSETFRERRGAGGHRGATAHRRRFNERAEHAEEGIAAQRDAFYRGFDDRAGRGAVDRKSVV